MTGPARRLSEGATNVIALTITGVWGMGYLADILLPRYDPPSQGSTIVLAMIGALFGSNLLNGRGHGGARRTPAAGR